MNVNIPILLNFILKIMIKLNLDCLISVSSKESVIDIIYPLLQISYKNTLGVGISKENLINTDGVFLIAKKDDKIIAGIIYKYFFGNKIRLVFHNGTIFSKKTMIQILIHDLKNKNVWVECSGIMEKCMMSIQTPYVKCEKSQLLLPTPIAPSLDNMHYSREVRPGIFKFECCMGYPVF